LKRSSSPLSTGPPPTSPAFLDEACHGNADLRRAVERMLAVHPKVGAFMESAPVAHAPGSPATVDDTPIAEKPGTVIGPYRLMEQVGQGGMGLVFVAEQVEPIRRKVALKIIKPGMDTRDVIARFEAERQALALMDHPNIAKVLDAGATDTARPYFVMELVRGIPITDYCDQNQLTPRERLGLFRDVCNAVQHAHQKGIIHRDLKPTNILVTSHDGTPVVKIIDFGVAKAIGQQLTDKTVYTRFTQMIGTPLYMSPEQAEMSGLDIDTRSDIYALGVLLYELLTGTTPFDRERLKAAAFDEIRRIIREEEPPKPSKRLSTLGATLATVSARRRLEPARLSALVRGDLDWIVMKALEKDRTRRYASADAMARDVERYLKDEPVEACPPSRWYLLRKFTRRNKRPLTLAALFAVLLIAGTTISIWQAVRAERAERRAKAERDAAQAAVDFLHDIVFIPVKAGDADLRKTLDRAAERIDARFGQHPLQEAHVRTTLGESYTWLGAYDKAEPHFVRAHEIELRKLGPDHRNAIITMHWLTHVYRVRGKLDLAEPMAKDGLERARVVFGEANSLPHQFRNELGVILGQRGRTKEAEAVLLESIAGLERIPGDHAAWEHTAARHYLAWVHEKQERWPEAEVLLRQVADHYRRVLGPERGEVAEALGELAVVVWKQKKYAETERLLRECLAIHVKTKPGAYNHQQTRSRLGETLIALRKFKEAEELLLSSEAALVKMAPADPKEMADHRGKLREFRLRLVRLYEAWDSPQELAAWQKKLDTSAAEPKMP
jgi:serine/threonine protein kinase/tetratricopeptide (TPR) repeat protein